MDTGFDYHEAKNIAHALGTRPDVLAVGGLFGILGMLVRQVSFGFALPWDPIAMGVVLSAVFHRVFMGYPLIGKVEGDGLFDMSPFEREEMQQTPEGGEVVADGGHASDASGASSEPRSDGGTATKQRLAVEPWLGHQYKWPNVAMIGLVTGTLAAYATVTTGSVFLGFGISAASLLFLNLGVEQIPVTHHMTLPGATAAAAYAGGAGALMGASTPAIPILIGALFGMIGALFGEVIQRIFYAHGDTHFDPPAAAIVMATFVIAVLAIVGVFPSSSWVPLPV
jgi:hypothetical protein